MYLFILESIGTSELILVGMIALIIFGPRKLPEMMRTFGKAMAEFKRSTNEFKQSWEKEVSFEDLAKMEPGDKRLPEADPGNTIGRDAPAGEKEIAAPEIKEIDQTDLESVFPDAVGAAPNSAQDIQNEAVEETKAEVSGKRDWL